MSKPSYRGAPLHIYIPGVLAGVSGLIMRTHGLSPPLSETENSSQRVTCNLQTSSVPPYPSFAIAEYTCYSGGNKKYMRHTLAFLYLHSL